MNYMQKLAMARAFMPLRTIGKYRKPIGLHNMDELFASQGSGKTLSNINLRRPGRKNLATRVNNLEDRASAVDRLNPEVRGQPDAKSQVFGFDSGSTRGAQDFGGTGNWHRTELAGGDAGTIRPPIAGSGGYDSGLRPLMESQRTFVDMLRQRRDLARRGVYGGHGSAVPYDPHWGLKGKLTSVGGPGGFPTAGKPAQPRSAPKWERLAELQQAGLLTPELGRRLLYRG